jgi:hypothetical protein
LTVYFLMGIFQTLAVLARGLGSRWPLFEEEAEPDVPRRRLTRQDLVRGLAVLTLLFGTGALVPFAENLYGSRYEEFDLPAALAVREPDIARAGLSLQEISSFLQHPSAEISVGRALYPRYYMENQGEVHFYPVVVMGFPRTTFTLVGPGGEKGIVLPGAKPDYFPHAVDALVIGCRESQYVDALAVIILDEKGAVYTRSPESPLQCPLRQPVCDNNHNCY